MKYTSEDRMSLKGIMRRSQIDPAIDIFDDRANELAAYWGKSADEVRRINAEFNELKTRRPEKFDGSSFQTIHASYTAENQLLRTKSRMMLHFTRFKKAQPVVEYVAPLQQELGRQPRMLDYGCGVGDYALAFHVNGYEITLVDLKGGMIDLAAWRFSQRNIEVRTVELDEERPYPDASGMDVIVCADVLEHMLNPPEAITRMHAMLNRGGYLWVPDYPFKEKSLGGGHIREAYDLREDALVLTKELFELVEDGPRYLLRKR